MGSFSDNPATYGMVILFCLCFWSLFSMSFCWLCWRPSLVSFVRVWSFFFPSALERTFSVLWCEVLITPSLCSSGCWESRIGTGPHGVGGTNDLFLGMIDVSVHWDDAICENLFLDFNFDPGLIYVPKLLAGCCSSENLRGEALLQ